MANVHYAPDQVQVHAQGHQTLLNAALAAGVPHTHVCGGMARCSTCRVVILEGEENVDPPNPREQALAAQLRLPPGIRIACQATVHGPVRVRRLVLDEEDVRLIGATASLAPTVIGEEIAVAILFADIRGFTAFTEALLPYDVVHVLNRYFEAMGRAIGGHGGFINTIMGDGLMALFGVDGQPDAPLRAVRAALDMLAAVDAFKPYLLSAYGRAFSLGIGMHYGKAFVGPLGAADHKMVTAIGDAVNLASCVETATKSVGARLLVSEALWYIVQQRVTVGRTAHVEVKGKSASHKLYEIVGLHRRGGVSPIR